MLIAKSGDGAILLIQAIKRHLSLKDKHLLQPRTRTAGVYLPFHTPQQDHQEQLPLISQYD
jgi:hypothetical protein